MRWTPNPGRRGAGHPARRDGGAGESCVDDASLESLLEMVPVTRGDIILVDAGTVHAMGPGVVILETQQTSDLTYRMYDYGSARELHLEKSLRRWG